MKRAFLVCGPESSGTRLITEILIAGGCDGDAGHEQRWDEDLPRDEPLIVIRRSVPHRAQIPDLAGIVKALRGRGYHVQAVVTLRDPFCVATSQLDAGHVRSTTESHGKQALALLHIMESLSATKCPFIVVAFEAVLMRPARIQERIASFLVLPEAPTVDVYDANRRHYEGDLVGER